MPGLTTPTTLRNLFTKLYSTFDNIAGNVSTDLLELAEVVPSTTLYNTYAWLGGIPRMREWVGQRYVRGLAQRTYQIYNKDYELTVGIDRDTLDDALLIENNMILRNVAMEAVRLRRDLIIDLMRNGQSRVGYDGQTFFNATHPQNVDLSATGTQSNYVSSGFALTRANFITARARLFNFVGENGRAFGAGRDLVLVVPPELQDTAESIVGVNMVAVSGGVQTNTLYNAARVIVVPELSTDGAGNSTNTTWYLFSLGGLPPPFILQERQAPRIVALTAPDAENMFWHKEYIFGVDARYGAGYGAWFRAFKAVG